MVLQTTANLQRLLSAYHNVPSRVVILKNEFIPCQQNKDNSIVASNNKLPSPPVSVSSKITYPISSQQEREERQSSHSLAQDTQASELNLNQDIAAEVELDMRFERKVVVYFGDKLAYEADSLVSVKDHKTLSLLAKHEFGLGQIFRYTKRRLLV